MTTKYKPPPGRPTGTCRACGATRTIRKDGALRAHSDPDRRGMNCRGGGEPPKGAGDRRPIWLLDVDGVLNAPNPGWGAAPVRRHIYSSHACREFAIRYSPELMRRIRVIHKTGMVEIRWCTTWCGDTTVLEKAFALPELGTAWTDYCNGYVAAAAKKNAARAVLAEGRPLIWTDDTEVPLESWDLHRELSAAGSVLLIRPDDRHGLQPRHLDAIENFIQPIDHLSGDC